MAGCSKSRRKRFTSPESAKKCLFCFPALMILETSEVTLISWEWLLTKLKIPTRPFFLLCLLPSPSPQAPVCSSPRLQISWKASSKALESTGKQCSGESPFITSKNNPAPWYCFKKRGSCLAPPWLVPPLAYRYPCRGARCAVNGELLCRSVCQEQEGHQCSQCGPTELSQLRFTA